MALPSTDLPSGFRGFSLQQNLECKMQIKSFFFLILFSHYKKINDSQGVQQMPLNKYLQFLMIKQCFCRLLMKKPALHVSPTKYWHWPSDEPGDSYYMFTILPALPGFLPGRFPSSINSPLPGFLSYNPDPITSKHPECCSPSDLQHSVPRQCHTVTNLQLVTNEASMNQQGEQKSTGFKLKWGPEASNLVCMHLGPQCNNTTAHLYYTAV